MRGDREGARVSVSLGPQAYDQLMALVARRNNVSAAWIVRCAIIRMITRATSDEAPLPSRTIRQGPRGRSKDGRVSVTLDPRTYAQLLALSRRDEVPISSMASRAVKELLDHP
jgi:hypothetical protein